jgi:hypothetical protein
MKYTVITLKENPELFAQQEQLCRASWPEFMMHDPVANKHWMRMIEAYPEHQILLLSDEGIIAAVITTIPLAYRELLEELPDRGWDWGIEKAIHDLEKHNKCNMLLALQVVVNPCYRGKGFSTLALKILKQHVKKYQFEALIIPVRPSQKSEYPLIRMEEYIRWTTEKGVPFVAWLRTHIKAGGRIIKVCEEAMKITGTVEEWEEWTALSLQQSGQFVVSGALNPVEVNIEKNEVLYIEPNVWVVHSFV